MRHEIKLIAAVGNSGQLGLNGEMPWGMSQKSDLQRFRELTTDGLIIVGHRTWPSVAHLQGTYGRAFLEDIPDVTPKQLLSAFNIGNRTVWIAGGAKTYARWWPVCTGWDISFIDYDGPADVWMPAEIMKQVATLQHLRIGAPKAA